MSDELREAIDRNQLFLLYQPQVDIFNGRIIGLEALVRWRHPVRGILGPGAFIPVAERSGLIEALGHWVLWEACRQTKIWFDEGIEAIPVGVNLSAKQFKRPLELENDISTALAETGLPPRCLELELTESVLMEAASEHNDVLMRLRQTGIRIAIDDFGTGYSNLDYLRRYPVDRIKIAQNFVKDLVSSPNNAPIIKATIGLARELGIGVIAEAVETEEQLQMLKAWGCREVQGFYFSKPLAPEDLTPLLRSGAMLPLPARAA
jgi:EAL domain-containing protein (putative c-di-GMP-specific phosphodiesterase class I)